MEIERLKKLKVKAFRGFVEEKEFEFAPLTIFFGPNGTGKSSTLNAIEWCFWGDKCIGRDTGIRERVGWEVKNRNSEEEPIVEIEFKDGKKIRRKWKREIEEESILKLTKKYSFNDFLVGVYQHQEVIRIILTQEPKVRNEGFDRLFGLSDYRNLLETLQEAIRRELRLNLDQINDEISNFQNEIKSRIEVWNRWINREKEELKSKGVEEEYISKEGEKKYKKEIIRDLQDFLFEMALEPSEDLKNLSTETKVKEFVNVIKKEIATLRSEIPDIKEHTELSKKKAILEGLLEGYKALKNSFKYKKKELKEFIEKNGSKSDLENEKNKLIEEIKKIESEIEQKNIQGSIINKAIEYLEKALYKDICPVCGKRTENLLDHLKDKWEREYKIQLEELKRKLVLSQDKKKKIEELIREIEKLENDLITAKKVLDGKIKEIEEKIRKEIRKDEDPEAILNKNIEDIERKLKELKERIERKQKALNEIEEKCSILDIIGEILEKVVLREKARDIEKSEKWRIMHQKREGLIKLKETLENITSAIIKASREEVQTKIKDAESKINEYFRSITKHPDIKDLILGVREDTRTGFNSYDIRDERENSVVPILSQGNLNALALSIFLALCEKLPFKFIILDDPSQSLSSSEKERFVEVLNRVSNQKQIIISTMDKELYDYLLKLPKIKKIYKFEKWDPQKGPFIREED
ncbi:MAG: AAA family ATPase [Candidatus Pacearchaeota archaeon]